MNNTVLTNKKAMQMRADIIRMQDSIACQRDILKNEGILGMLDKYEQCCTALQDWYDLLNRYAMKGLYK